MELTRRTFLKILTICLFMLSQIQNLFAKGNRKSKMSPFKPSDSTAKRNLGVSEDGMSYVYIAKNNGPEENMRKAIELMGGIEQIIKENDIVVLKPNAQWWNQGMTNTDAMKAFIEMVFEIPDFRGEIIIAENHHYLPENSRGWTTDKRNGRFNYNELIEYFNLKGFQNVTKYHWRDGGLNPEPLQGDDGSNGVVEGPGGNDGYIWKKDIIYLAPNGRKCMMTYPLFTSTYSGITIDLMNGAWKNGSYIERPVKLINFSALNHHGIYAGVTASIKNYMGIVDMTCGLHGTHPKGFYNAHYIGVSRLMRYKEFIWKTNWRVVRFLYRNFYYTGGALGYFMKHIRKADLDIITAERVGWGNRTDITKSLKTKAILLSKDPVALDLVASESILSKVTPHSEEYLRLINNGAYKKGPFYKFLSECHKQGVGNLKKEKIITIQ